MQDSHILDVGMSTDGLRWRFPDGRTGLVTGDGVDARSTYGWTGRPDPHTIAFGECGAGVLSFDGQAATLIRHDVQETTFQGEGETLFGRLVLPAGEGPVPVVVQVHGSGSWSATTFLARQRMLPAEGIGVFAYDKRGTGRSTGTYTQDFHLLAADAAAAAREARRLAGPRLGALAYEGVSQGGWVAPLAAAIEPVDRIIVGYGLTVSPLEENRSEVLLNVSEAGYGSEALEGAGELADATGVVIASNFTSGFRELAEVRKRYRSEPWFDAVQGEFTGEMLSYPTWLVQLTAPIIGRRANRGTTWSHEPLPVLRSLDVPILWVLAGSDREAPPEQTRTDLIRLQGEGRRITILEFPDTDHGILEFETLPDGRRVNTRAADGYLSAVADFARDGRLAPVQYGNAVLIGN
ncbi:MAG: alpha/beta hydrolase family protein [Hyphomonas sp.]